MVVACKAAAGSWLFPLTVSDAVMLWLNTREGYCRSYIAWAEQSRDSPLVKRTSAGSPRSTRPTTALQMAAV